MSARSHATRRRFLQMSGYAAAAASLGSGARTWADTTQSVRPMQAWVTADTRRFEKFDVPAWKPADQKTRPSIQIDPRTWYQEILGFGGAFTDASCYMFSQLNAADRAALLRDLYGPDGLRFSLGRI